MRRFENGNPDRFRPGDRVVYVRTDDPDIAEGTKAVVSSTNRDYVFIRTDPAIASWPSGIACWPKDLQKDVTS